MRLELTRTERVFEILLIVGKTIFWLALIAVLLVGCIQQGIRESAEYRCRQPLIAELVDGGRDVQTARYLAWQACAEEGR